MPVQKRTKMYKNQSFIEVEYQEVGSKLKKNTLFGWPIPPVKRVISQELKSFRVHPVAKGVAKVSVIIMVKALSLTGQVIWFFATLVFFIASGLFIALLRALRDTFATGFTTPFTTGDDIDWRDVTTGQRRCPKEVSRQCRKEGGNVYININNY
jgi:hypothetical protein